MARTTLTAVSWPNSNGAQFFPTLPITAGSQLLSFVAGDSSNDNFVAISNSKTVVLAYNADQTNTHTLTIHSVVDASNRTGDITNYVLPPSSIATPTIVSFGPFTSAGWNQTSPAGLWIDPTATNVQFCVVNNP